MDDKRKTNGMLNMSSEQRKTYMEQNRLEYVFCFGDFFSKFFNLFHFYFQLISKKFDRFRIIESRKKR